MPRYRMSEEDKQWWAEDERTPSDLARRLGCCFTTAVRVLVRERLISTNSLNSKYFPAERQETWRRPCMKCKSTAPRPKNQYICGRCWSKHGEDINGDDWDLL